MDFRTFKAALKHADSICIGGGEPTIHPKFEKFLFYALAHCDYIQMVTNGSITNTALALAKLNQMGEGFYAELSQDPYHDPIEQKVIDAFKNRIWDTSKHLINAGRCDFGVRDDCICDGDPFVKPNGDVHQCGCEDSPKVGTVFDKELRPINSYENYGEWICHKKVAEMV